MQKSIPGHLQNSVLQCTVCCLSSPEHGSARPGGQCGERSTDVGERQLARAATDQRQTHGFEFLPRATQMLARYLLSSRVRLSVRHKPVLRRNDWTAGEATLLYSNYIYSRFCG